MTAEQADAIRSGAVSRPVAPADRPAALDRGWTIHVENAHMLRGPMATVGAMLQRTLGGMPLRGNLYGSPPGSPATGVHHDAYDAVVVQFAGRKRWYVWDRTELGLPADPVLSMPWRDHDPHVGASAARTIVLEPGDVLVVRRGDPHAAVALAGGMSLHGTFMVAAPTAQDFLRHVATAAAQDESCRTVLPPPGLRVDDRTADWAAGALVGLLRWLEGADHVALVEDFLRQWVVQAPPPSDRAEADPPVEAAAGDPRLHARLGGRPFALLRSSVVVQQAERPLTPAMLHLVSRCMADPDGWHAVDREPGWSAAAAAELEDLVSSDVLAVRTGPQVP